MQPGDTITPGQQSAAPEPEEAKPESPQAANQPTEKPESVSPVPPQASKPPEPDPKPDVPVQDSRPARSFHDDDSQPDVNIEQFSPSPEVKWTASEFIAHDKGTSWYFGLAGLSVLAAATIYLVTQDVITVVMIGIVAVIFGVFASRQPRVLTYQIDSSGITIADKHYPYSSFRSFAIQDEGAIDSIFLIPLKRFMPGLSVYFPPEQEDEIVGTLGNYLPHEERPQDAVDRLMRKVRF